MMRGHLQPDEGVYPFLPPSAIGLEISRMCHSFAMAGFHRTRDMLSSSSSFSSAQVNLWPTGKLEMLDTVQLHQALFGGGGVVEVVNHISYYMLKSFQNY